jgi:RimJ/RimL family protein N-acetyltransferase
LTGRFTRLEPLAYAHAVDLWEAARFAEIWTYLDEPAPETPADIERFIADALQDQADGRRIPYAIIDMVDNHAVGSTSFIDIRPNDRGLEIGSTWLTPSRWRTGINADAKLLLLAYAFSKLHAVRVAFKTDERNIRSQKAIERLGAVREGVWRNHRLLSDGTRRNSVVYSIIEGEHEAVLVRLYESLYSARSTRAHASRAGTGQV